MGDRRCCGLQLAARIGGFLRNSRSVAGSVMLACVQDKSSTAPRQKAESEQAGKRKPSDDAARFSHSHFSTFRFHLADFALSRLNPSTFHL
jgi:hypothetical protein